MCRTPPVIKRIVLVAGCSSCSERTADYVSALARALGAEVLLVHVSELPPGLSEDTLLRPAGQDAPLPVRDYLAADGHRRLDPLRAHLQAVGVTAHAATRVGPQAQTILALARRFGADLIVVGVHRRSWLSRLRGGLADRLAALSPVLVLNLPGGDGACAVSEAEVQVRAEVEG